MVLTRTALLFLLVVAGAGASIGRHDVAVEKFPIDQAHSAIEFTIRFMGLTTVRGRFAGYRGVVMYVPEDLTQSTVRVRIAVASIDTDNDTRDGHLRSPDFFDAEHFPSITFASDSIRAAGEPDAFLVYGPLTIKDVTRPVVIAMHREHGEMTDGWENIRVGFTGVLAISRREFGVVGGTFWNRTLDLERLAVADSVNIQLNIQGRVPNYDRRGFDSHAKPSIGEALEPVVAEQGAAAAVAAYRQLRAADPEAHNFAVRELDILGYRLLQHSQFDAAVAVLELNQEVYPESVPGLESLAEAYALAGDNVRSARFCRMALERDSTREEPRETLRWLEREPTARFTWPRPGR